MAPSPVDEINMIDLDRSNRGASKQRRDQINGEISTMRDLLPLAESARQRLSQLQIMSLSCVYIRKCNILQKLFRSSRQGKDLPCDFFQALTGFILVTTREGKLLYISENVTDFLGHSMVDMKTQGDSLYDIVDKRDHVAVQTQLQGGDAADDVSFYCRMNMSRSLKRQAGFGDVKVMHVRGHFTNVPAHDSGSEQQFVFMATCTPLTTPELKENLVQNNTMIFKTVHQLDMTFIEMTETAEHHLGYSNAEIKEKSWYTLLHPDDIYAAREKHVQLIRSSHEMGCMITVRMLRADGSSIWINMVMHVRQASVASNDEPVIVCINQVISEQEAYQFKLQSSSFSIYPLRTGEMWTQSVNLPAQNQTTQWMPNSPNYAQYSSMRHSPHGIQDQISHSQYVNDRRGGRTNQPNTNTSLHTEKVKQMLQKKITGCKPAKIPRVSITDRADKPSSYRADFGLGQPTNFYFSSFEPFSDTALSFEAFGQTPTQMMSVSNYAVSKIPTLQKKSVMVEPSILNQSACMSPNLLEQVVPDSCRRIPDSYLTPDSSPASSPEHKSSCDQISILDSSFEILEDLSKIEQFQQVQEMEKLKTEVEKFGRKRKRNELPSIDPMEIVSYFDGLTPMEKLGHFVLQKPVIKEEKTTCCVQSTMPVFDTSDIEEFLNYIDVEPCSPLPLCIKQEPLESRMLVDSSCYQPLCQSTNSMQYQSPSHCMPSPESSISGEYSPGPSYTSELSEEELMDELNCSPIQMVQAVDVAKIKEEFEALQQAHVQPQIVQETELHHLHRLLRELVPSTGSRSLIKDSQ